MNCPTSAFPRHRHLFLLLVVGALFIQWPRGLMAAPKYGTSLDWAPADTSFYSSGLRLREQFDIVVNSNAFKKIAEMSSVQSAWQTAQFFLAFSAPGATVQRFFNDPSYGDLREFIIDAVSHEICIFGDKKATDFLQTVVTTISAMQYRAGLVDTDDSNTTARILLNSLNAHIDQLATPGLVVGFKVTNVERAKQQIDNLKELLDGQLEDHSDFEGRLSKKSVGGSEYLVLELDGSLIQVPWDEIEQEPGEYEKLKSKLQNLKASICLGVRDNYVLLAIEPTVDALAKLGTGKKLAEVKEFQALAKFADKKLISVSYSSQQFIEALNNPTQQIDNMVATIRQGLSQIDLDDEIEQRIDKDLEELGDDLKGILPKPGANMRFSYLTDRGIEGYGYDWSENTLYDGSKPLSLLDHVGGNPLLALVARGKYSPEQYDMVRKWAKMAFGYFEEFATPQMSPDDQETFKKVKELGMPLVERLDKANSEMLIPALADGQSAVVLDAKLVSSKWFMGMRQNDQPLPMIETALVFGVSDTALLKKGVEEYRSALVDLIAQLKKEELIPQDSELPKPETREVKTDAGMGTIYYYKLPEEAGIDAQLTPNAGLSERVAVLSISPKQSARLLQDTPLTAGSDGPLSDRSKALESALYFNWAETVDAITPWAEYAVHQFVDAYNQPNSEDEGDQSPNAEAGDEATAKEYLEQLRTVMSALKCLRTYQSASYPEGDATVTHSATEFKDVP
ncbi:MAG: hypothetical protein IT427_20645 [Pirellulales bacterium]|nr:hypothetical protein [Pirellulales bacterium]